MSHQRCYPAACLRLLAALAALLSGTCTLASSAFAAGQGSDVLTKNENWGRFRPGAWQEVHIVTETMGPKGEVTGTTTSDKMTTLVAVGPQSVRLQVEVTAEVAGKRFDAPPQQIDEGCHGEPVGESVAIRDLGAGTATIEEKNFPCQIREYEITDGDNKKDVKVFYSGQVVPHVLRRESVTKNVRGGDDIMQERDDVIALDMPQKVLKQILPAALIRSVQRTDATSTTTLSAQVTDVPGGLVAASTKELDAEGKLVRRSTLEIVDWGVQSDKDVDGKYHNRRRDARRIRRHEN